LLMGPWRYCAATPWMLACRSVSLCPLTITFLLTHIHTTCVMRDAACHRQTKTYDNTAMTKLNTTTNANVTETIERKQNLIRRLPEQKRVAGL
jgi:hypothetical protein